VIAATTLRISYDDRVAAFAAYRHRMGTSR
jgi:hypothetical protein